MTVDLENYDKTFLGVCHGVGLSWRGPRDKHVCFTIFSGDDGHWYTSENSASSFWLPEVIRLLQEAQAWIEQNCRHSKDKCGWTF